jgi:TPR repeat protein
MVLGPTCVLNQCCGKRVCMNCCASYVEMYSGQACPLCRTNFPNDDHQCKSMLKERINQGKAWAQHALAVSLSGDPQAFVLLSKAAAQGYARSQTRLGLTYYYGEESCEPDSTKARQWLETAMPIQNDWRALGLLGKLHLE